MSAAVVSAKEVIRCAVPILAAEGVTFKIAGSLPMLAELNSGALGMSQIGKFITVYPEGDDQAVRLAGCLDAATRGMRGPQIPSDRALVAAVSSTIATASSPVLRRSCKAGCRPE